VDEGAGHVVVDVFFCLGAGGVVLLHLERGGTHDEEHGFGSAKALHRLRSVFAVLPCGIVLDALDGDVAGHAVAACELDGVAGEGREGVHEGGKGFAPDPGLHAAHGGAEDETEVIYVEAFEEHDVLRGDHVVVVVLGELHVEGVGGLGGLAVADVVREDEKVFGDVEGLSGAEEDVGEDWVHQGVRVAAGAVEEEDGVVGVTIGSTMRLAEGDVVEVELFNGLAVLEVEVGDVVGAVLSGPFAGGGILGGRDGRGCKEGKEGEAGDHDCGVSIKSMI